MKSLLPVTSHLLLVCRGLWFLSPSTRWFVKMDSRAPQELDSSSEHGGLRVRAGNCCNSFTLLGAKRLPLEQRWSTSVRELQTHVNVRQTNWCSHSQEVFKSAALSPVLSNWREGEKRNTFWDYFMICFCSSVSVSIWLCARFDLFPDLLHFELHFLKIWAFKNVLVERLEGEIVMNRTNGKHLKVKPETNVTAGFYKFRFIGWEKKKL